MYNNELKRAYDVNTNLFLPTKKKHLQQKLEEIDKTKSNKSFQIEHKGIQYDVSYEFYSKNFNYINITNKEDNLELKTKKISKGLRKLIQRQLFDTGSKTFDLDTVIINSPKVYSFLESHNLTNKHSIYFENVKKNYKPSSLVQKIKEVTNDNTEFDYIINRITFSDMLITISRVALTTIIYLPKIKTIDLDIDKLYSIYNRIKIVSKDQKKLGQLRNEYLSLVVEIYNTINKRLEDTDIVVGFNGKCFNFYIHDDKPGSKALFDIACQGIEILLDLEKLLDLFVASEILKRYTDIDLDMFPNYYDKLFITLVDIVTKTPLTTFVQTLNDENKFEEYFFDKFDIETIWSYHILDCLGRLTRTIYKELYRNNQTFVEDELDV